MLFRFAVAGPGRCSWTVRRDTPNTVSRRANGRCSTRPWKTPSNWSIRCARRRNTKRVIMIDCFKPAGPARTRVCHFLGARRRTGGWWAGRRRRRRRREFVSTHPKWELRTRLGPDLVVVFEEVPVISTVVRLRVIKLS